MSRPLILHCLDGLGIGGAERQLVLLLRHAPAAMFDHAVCLVGPRRDLVSEVRALGIPVYDLCDGRRQVVRAVARLARLMHRLRPALVHADHDYGKLCARLAARILQVPLLATMGNTTVEPSGARRRRFHPRALKHLVLDHVSEIAAARSTDHYLAISETVRQDLIAHGVAPARISVVYRGIDLDEFIPIAPQRLAALRASLMPEHAGPVVLHIGRLVTQKGQDDLIRAMPAIRRDFPTARLLLAGDGPNRKAYEMLAQQAGVADAIMFLGIRRDVQGLLQLADVFAFPSIREGTGVALLEAMALSRACVASRLPVMEEVLGNAGAGLLVPPRQPELLGQAILSLLADPVRRETMGRRSRQIVEQRFDIRQNAVKFAELCQSVLDARRVDRPAVSMA